MDINFHYFAVKTLALKAGFNDVDAQTIASYSQFIDDYNWYFYLKLTNIPDYVKSPDYDLYVNWGLVNFNPATTGFSDFIDYATLLLPRSQKFTVAPFHFIPQNKDKVNQNLLRVVPAVLNDGSYISNYLEKVKQEFLSGAEQRQYGLMKIGMVLHTFADTYAHQMFTGYNSWENNVLLDSVYDNLSGKDVTKEFHYWLEEWQKRLKILPTIGHMMLGHIPDLTYLRFGMKYKPVENGDYQIYSRSNTSEFIMASHEIINYLSACNQSNPLTENEWQVFSQRVAQGFLVHYPEENEQDAVKALTPHWSMIFPEYATGYKYNNTIIKNRFITDKAEFLGTIQIENEEFEVFSQTASDEFYKYNCFADQLLIELYGPHPRKKWFTVYNG